MTSHTGDLLLKQENYTTGPYTMKFQIHYKFNSTLILQSLNTTPCMGRINVTPHWSYVPSLSWMWWVPHWLLSLIFITATDKNSNKTTISDPWPWHYAMHITIQLLITDKTMTTGDFRHITMTTYDLRHITMTTGDLWSITMITCDLWHITMTTDDLWHITMTSDDLRLITMTTGDLRHITITTHDLWSITMTTGDLWDTDQ